MLHLDEKKAYKSKNITAYTTCRSMNGAAMITDEGKEIPITSAMIDEALRALEHDVSNLH